MPTLARGNPARWWKSRSCGGASRAPRGLFIGPVRRWASRIALTLLILLITGFWYITRPERISRLSEVLLSRVLGGNVKVRSGHLSYSGTLILSGIEVKTSDPEATPSSDIPIFTAEQIEARFDWFSLLSGQLAATQLVATTPVFHPIEDGDTGHWNYERLRPGFGTSSPRSTAGKGLSLPVVILRDAHVMWGEVRQGKVQQTAETVIDGDMTPDPALNSTYHFSFTQFAPADAAGIVKTGASLRGTWDSAMNQFNIFTENVIMSDTLRDGLPRVARDWCAEHHLAGRLSKLNLSFNPREGLMVTVTFDDVSMMWMIEPEQGIALGDERPAYPLDLGSVRGQVVFSLNQNVMRIIDLRGKILGYDFIANSSIQGMGNDFNPNHGAPFDLDLRFPNASVSDHYPPLFLAFSTSQDIIQRMEPHGRMDIAVQAHRIAPRGVVQYEGQIDLHDARLRYAHFPAPMDHMNGLISFNNESVTFHDVTGKSDLIDARISGTCGMVWTNRFVDMTISSPNLLLDDRLAACLPSQYQEIWNLFALNAKGSFVCHVTRGASIMDQQKIALDLDIMNASGYLRAVPYPFTQASGHLHLEADDARIEHFTARTGADGSGRITLDGVVRHSGDDVTHLQPELHLVADVPIDAALLHALPDALTDRLVAVKLGGRLGYDGTLRRTGDVGAETVQMAGTLNWKQGTLQAAIGTQPFAFSDINAQVVLSPTALDVKSLAATWDAGGQKLQIQLAGKVDVDSLSGLFKVSLAGKNVELPGQAPPIFPPSIRDTWATYAPAGLLDLSADGTLRLNLPGNPASAKPALRLSDNLALDSYTARVTLHDVTLKERTWPDSMTHINGKIELLPGVVSMTGMSATMGNVALAWTGRADPDTGKITLSGDATSKGLPTQWLNHLPPAFAENLDQKRADVSLALHLDSLTRSATGKPWELQGKLQATNLATVSALPMTLEHVDFTGQGVYTPASDSASTDTHATWFAFSRLNAPRADSGAFDFHGLLAATRVSVNDRIIETLSASVIADSLHHEIMISDLDGKVAGGTLQGHIQIRTSGPLASNDPSAAVPGTLPAGIDGGYIADLVLNDAELGRLVLSDKATNEERKTIGTGRVTASLSLQQTFGAGGAADRTGRGDLIVRDGDIYNVPLSMGLMQVATLRLPVARSFQQASMSYYLRNDQITFERILLESQGINLAGLGTVSLSTREMDMSFLTESHNEVYIPFFTPLGNSLRNQLLEVSVTGTIDNPKITPVPLSAISNLLRAILPRTSADARHK